MILDEKKIAKFEIIVQKVDGFQKKYWDTYRKNIFPLGLKYLDKGIIAVIVLYIYNHLYNVVGFEKTLVLAIAGLIVVAINRK